MSETVPETPELEVTEPVTEEPAVEKTVPAERFNGLQRAHQQALARLRELEASSQQKPEAERQSMPEEVTTDIQQALEQQQQVINALLVERWQNKAVQKHPEIAPFTDLLQGSTEQDYLSLADDFASRLKAGQKPADAAAEATEAQAPATPTGPPVPAGTPSVVGPNAEDEIAAARAAAKRNPGDERPWSELLRLKYAAKGLEY